MASCVELSQFLHLLLQPFRVSFSSLTSHSSCGTAPPRLQRRVLTRQFLVVVGTLERNKVEEEGEKRRKKEGKDAASTAKSMRKQATMCTAPGHAACMLHEAWA